MTEKEMDTFFVETLKKILADMEECAEYIKDCRGKAYREVKEDYGYVIADISDIVENIKSVNDLAAMDEDTIGAVFEYFEAYGDNLVISSEPEQQKKDLEEYGKIEEFLELFYDDEDEEDE